MKLYPSIDERLKTQHLAIGHILLKIAPRRLLKRPQPNKWNIHDNLAHLASYQPTFIERVNQVLINDQPLFGRYEAAEDPAFEDCRALASDDLVKQLSIDRQKITGLLTNLTDAELNRIGVHKKYGPLNIVQWTEFFLLHEAHHIFTIFQLAHDTELQ
ncbi:MAG: DinB family protein [Ferruginibacter sp.]